MNEDALYDKVAQEIQAQVMVPGVWAKAFSEAGGELDKARALYIKYRVAQLMKEANEKVRREERIAAEAVKQRRITGFRRFVFGCLAVVFGFAALLALVAGGSVPYDRPPLSTSDATVFIIVCVGFFAVFIFLLYVCAKAAKR
jgi:hypothetical protein